MIKFVSSTENTLIEIHKENQISLEGDIIKLINTESPEFSKYLEECIVKDTEKRRRRLSVTKQIQEKNQELENKQQENEILMGELQEALEEAEESRYESEKLKQEALEGKEKALEDLDLMQKKSQFELINVIVRVALFLIAGVGIITTIMYCIAIIYNKETQIVGSTWSNMFGILLTNAFSIVGTIMGVKYANDSLKTK